MQDKETTISIIFNPGRGSIVVRSMNTTIGTPLPSLPHPTLAGYVFEGWFSAPSGGKKLEAADTALLPDGTILYAHYTKKKTAKSTVRGKSMMKKQKVAIIALAATVILLIAAYFVVQYIISIYIYDDSDGTRYYIKKNDDGEYCLYDADGNLCPSNTDGYYITKSDNQLSIDKETGKCELYAVIDTEDGEVLGNSSRIMIFKQLTYDEGSSTAVADVSRVIQTINVNNSSGKYTFARTILLYDEKTSYSIGYDGNGYVLYDKDTNVMTKNSDGMYSLSTAKMNVSLDKETGRYRAATADSAFTVEYKTSLTVNGETKPLYNIEIHDGSKVYYIVPSYMTGSGASYYLYTISSGALTPCTATQSSSGISSYRLSNAKIELDTETYGSYFITGDNSSFTFGCANGMGSFTISGHSDTPYNYETFASLAVACGYTLSMDKLPLAGDINYAEYGLVPQTRTDEEGKSYEYTPAEFTVTSASGDTYTVIVGDSIVSGAGYYVKSSVRNAVYILSSSGLSTTVLQPIESIVTPTIVYPSSLSTYSDVKDFEYLRDIDYKAIAEELKSETEESLKTEDIEDEEWRELIRRHSKLVCKFSYIPLEERQNTLDSTYIYDVQNEVMKGYKANDDNISKMLQSLYSMTFLRVCKLSPDVDGEDFEKYDLETPAYILSYQTPINGSGKVTYVDNYVEISKPTEKGTYYAYSALYDMIVEIEASQLAFLEWSDINWYKLTVFDEFLAYVPEIKIESPNFNVNFTIDNSGSSMSAYYGIRATDGKFILTEKTDDGTTVTYSAQKTESGYILVSDSEKFKPELMSTRDFIVAAQTASMTKYRAPSADGKPNVILTETQSDDDAGTKSYYYYYVEPTKDGYYIAVATAVTDSTTGDILSSNTNTGSPAYSTDYFISSDNNLYLIDKASPSGIKLGTTVEGKWYRGNVFYTAKGAYYLINEADGSWCKLSGLTQKIYINKSGSHVNDGIAGIHHNGYQYKTANGTKLLLDISTGELGYMTTTTANASEIVVYADGKELDYKFTIKDSRGDDQEIDDVKNFRGFYTALISASIEGEIDLTEEELEARFKSLPDSECQLVFTVYAEDLSGSARYMKYRFYKYSERHSYMTIEMLDGPDGESDAMNGHGRFYVLSSFVDKLIADSQRVVKGEYVKSDSKY